MLVTEIKGNYFIQISLCHIPKQNLIMLHVGKKIGKDQCSSSITMYNKRKQTKDIPLTEFTLFKNVKRLKKKILLLTLVF